MRSQTSSVIDSDRGEPLAIDTTPPVQGRIVYNLTCLCLAGTFVCFWVWRYTDVFEELAAILTLSGALSWLAVMLKLVPEDEVKAFQNALFRAIAKSVFASVCLTAVFLLVIVGSLAFGTIQLEPLQESVDRPVVIVPMDDGADASRIDWATHIRNDDFETLSPGKTLRKVVTVGVGLRRKFIVKISGYPDKQVTIRSWQRLELIVPNSLRRPVVLLRPSESVLNMIRQRAAHPDPTKPSRWTISVRLPDRPELKLEMPFDGRPIWLGCDENVEVPTDMQALAEMRLSPELVPYSRFPVAFPTGNVPLTAGQRLEVTLLPPDGVSRSSTHIVEDLAPRPGFLPQTVALDIGS